MLINKKRRFKLRRKFRNNINNHMKINIKQKSQKKD